MRSERDYYYRRAEAELEQAQRSTSAEAVRVHYTLAGHYLDRVYGSDQDNEPPVVDVAAHG